MLGLGCNRVVGYSGRVVRSIVSYSGRVVRSNSSDIRPFRLRSHITGGAERVEAGRTGMRGIGPNDFTE